MIVTTDEFKRERYFKARFIMSVIILLIYMIIIMLFTSINSNQYLLLFMVGLSKVAENLLDINFAYYIKEQKHRFVGYFKLGLSFLQMGLIIALYYTIGNLVLPFTIYSLLTIVCFFIINKQAFVLEKLNVNEYKKLISLGIPLSITLFLSSLNTNIPKYVLEYASSIAAVGIFSSILTIYSAGNTFFFSIYNYVLPKAVENKFNFSYLKKLLVGIIIGGIFSYVIVIIVSFTILDNIIVIMFNQKFLAYKLQILIIIFSAILVYMSILFDLYINAHNKYKYNTRIQVISVIIVLLSSLILINLFGILGATYTFTIFAISIFVMKLILSLKIIKGVKNEI
ncbi:hypothetical protein BUZ11_01385 [Staphylococcus gallinarum]|nr:hypothetical protein BUZ11_01385 [Staphylococcus gallinarum]